ncbi:prolipoprotein diacylglyceryl transferase family protein [Bremerella sp. JC817]|uniref:prolipoprotein diacylglyceryl transferase family protein n=1 Tax=Bremerella sp. JC817 TaxID=3231756 RepID=UPI00345B0838
MQRTLLLIPVPEQLFGLPVVGWGWLLIVWGIIVAIWIGLLSRKPKFQQELLGHLPLFVVVSAAIVYVLPMLRVEEAGQWGFPVRGYGVLLVAAIVSAVGLAAYRAQRMGLNPEVIYSLAMVIIVCGVIGARVFFVIQYWDNFYRPGDWRATLGEIFKVTEGGIVVYGSLIGAAVSFAVFCYRKQIPPLALADLIAPSLMIGMFFGRLGCFMNGCCYGGLCTLPTAVQFPPDSPPFQRHMENGSFYGLLFAQDDEGDVRIANILPDSAASKNDKIEIGDTVLSINGYALKGQPVPPMEVLRSRLMATWMTKEASRGLLEMKLKDKGSVPLHVDELPARSLPVHPTQIYSSINGLILCLLVLAYYPFRKVDGEVIALTLGLYSVARFLLEVIRTDEYAIGGTGLTISQNVSVVIFLLSVTLFVYARLRKEPLAWPRVSA